MEDETDNKELRFRELVRQFVPIVGTDKDKDINEFFKYDYTIILLKGNGLIGYTEHENHIWWWYLYDDNNMQNRRKIVKIAKNMQKRILYTGKSDFFHNNSVKIMQGVYQLMI